MNFKGSSLAYNFLVVLYTYTPYTFHKTWIFTRLNENKFVDGLPAIYPVDGAVRDDMIIEQCVLIKNLILWGCFYELQHSLQSRQTT